jgi:hypothetical protein
MLPKLMLIMLKLKLKPLMRKLRMLKFMPLLSRKLLRLTSPKKRSSIKKLLL